MFVQTCVDSYITGTHLFTESSSSFLSLANLTRTRNGTFLTPCDHKCLFKRVSILTSLVPICFSANFFTSLIALGARYLNPMPWRRLCKLMVYSRVTTSPKVDFVFFSLGIFIYPFWKPEIKRT